MSGLFGGKKSQQVVYVPQQADTAQAAKDAKKGATDLEKMKNKKSMQDSYGKAVSSDLMNFSGLGIDPMNADSTLASGSLLSLGGKLG